ncbi:ABC transporter permease [Neptunitalea lumnitzerae]|uniref:ABC transporter permease n=1 Tax=Neptunitalea lumnitzerae TaxID=2965509 RepID=A0ABQ5MKN4_9FLAO|nr:ABC transporter permease [Neptunitalea sp. Y10]GLB49971.1 ABC transporter permease [Neptunitalea sp. Y10]
MKRLLQIEFIKLWNSRASKILIIAYFAILSLISILASIKFDIGEIHFRLADQGIFNFPYIWHLNTWIAGFLKIFFAIVIVSMMSNEYTNKTLKQNLIDGLSKKEFVLSKFYMVLIFSLVSTIFICILTLVLGLIFSDFNTPLVILKDTDYLLAYFVKLLGFFSICLFLGMLVRKSAFALGFLFIWYILEWIGYSALNHYFPDNSNIPDKIFNFFPINSLANLVKEPVTRFNPVKTASNLIGETIVKDYLTHWYEYAIALAWTFIFIFFTHIILKKRNL